MNRHIDSYIICATPRSGSTLLCDLLTDTGIAGCPDSFFRKESFLWWANYLDVPAAHWRGEHEFDHTYLSAVKQYGSAGTQVFGMRLMWESVDDLSIRLESFYPELPNDVERFRAVFGKPLYLYLSRQDKVAQAVSHLKAEQSGLWHVSADGTERERLKTGQRPVYNAESLSEIIAMQQEHDAAWEDWFSQRHIDPLRITYEMLSSEPQAILAKVLSVLGLDPAVAKSVNPRTAKLADRESRDWASRFRSEKTNHG